MSQSACPGSSTTRASARAANNVNSSLSASVSKSGASNRVPAIPNFVASLWPALEEALLPIADPFQTELSRKIVPSYRVKLAQVGRYFAAGAGHREATKFGILLLEVAGTRFDAPLLE